MASQFHKSMQLTSNTSVQNDEESIKDSSFNVSEKVENATQIQALKEGHSVCKSIQLNEEAQKNGSIEDVDQKVSICTELIIVCLCNFFFFLCEYV